MEQSPEVQFTPALIAKERQLLNTLRALECMLETIQDLRTKVNFERTQLITLVEMASNKNQDYEPMPLQPSQVVKFDDSSPKDPLVLLDKLYNGAFCVSEEEDEEDDELDDDDFFIRGDNFGTDDDVQW